MAGWQARRRHARLTTALTGTHGARGKRSDSKKVLVRDDSSPSTSFLTTGARLATPSLKGKAACLSARPICLFLPHWSMVCH